ncbi:hypothetical protein [Heyndrickxia faecalis]|uniref:hypothetical protein n=1 Tax=Heyndrickxia faecalis TaxID=2824910 RepID=UPI003D24FEA6
MAVILQAEGTVGRFYLPKEVETVLINKAYKFRICPTKNRKSYCQNNRMQPFRFQPFF